MTDTGTQKYAFFEGEFVPIEQAKVSVMTHAFNYGTGVFEGIRGYWNADHQEIYIVFLRDHFKRFLKNCRMICVEVPYSLEQLVDIAVKLVSANGYEEDVYIRPIAYKSSEHIGVSMEGVADALTIYTAPFGNYVDIDRGLSVCVSSWVRTADNAIPSRGKITGNYVNSALAKNEAVLNGYDEAIVLNSEGFVAEASAANVYLVREGVLLTPAYHDSILEGLTRNAIAQLARDELGVSTVERPINRSELYYAEEMFICGTGVQIAPITSVDRRLVGNGEIGPIASKLQRLYFDIVRGNNPKYRDWLTAVNASAPAERVTVSAS